MDVTSLSAFIELLGDALGPDWQLVHDRRLRPGDSIERLTALLDSVDAVIVLLTPQYARRVRDREGGAYEEYAIIMDRYQEVPEGNDETMPSRTAPPFDLIPVLFAGDDRSAVPQDLRRILYSDFSGFRVPKRPRTEDGLSARRQELVIPRKLQQRFRAEFGRIASKLSAVREMHTPDSEQRFDEYLEKLFLVRKANVRNPMEVDRRQIGDRFVKTRAFERLLSGSAYFVFGRKGSGKSTLAGVLSSREHQSRHHGAILIYADVLNLQLWYTTLMAPQPRSDMAHIFRTDKCFRFAWQLFQASCCVEHLALLNDSAKLTDYQSNSLAPLREWYARVVPPNRRDGDTKSALFVFALNQVRGYMEHCIAHARADSEYFESDIELQFNVAAFLRHALGPVADSLRQALAILRHRILFAVDGFDIAFEAFRRNAFAASATEEARAKAQFESEWIRALMQVVLSTKERDSDSDWLSDHLDYCVAVPLDRFLEIVATERDSFRYSDRYVPLVWSGIELAILVRKRLEVLLGFESEDGTPEARLNAVLERAAKHLPTRLPFRFNDKQYELSLFSYVLRHTFWRPREVLWYFARILNAAEGLRRQRQSMGAEAVRQIVRNTTIEVVTTEFIGELSSTFTNVGPVLAAFAGSRQRMHFGEVSQRLSTMPFEFAIASEPIRDAERQIAILYSLGFLGIVADKEMTDKFALREKYIFAFAEGLLPLRAARAKDGLRTAEFVIHPAFCEYLTLDTSHEDLVLQLTWDYLHEAEQTLFNTPHTYLFMGE